MEEIYFVVKNVDGKFEVLAYGFRESCVKFMKGSTESDLKLIKREKETQGPGLVY